MLKSGVARSTGKVEMYRKYDHPGVGSTRGRHLSSEEYNDGRGGSPTHIAHLTDAQCTVKTPF